MIRGQKLFPFILIILLSILILSLATPVSGAKNTEGEGSQAENIDKKIKGRKELYKLARRAEKEEDYQEAEQYYLECIQTYSDDPKTVLTASHKLIKLYKTQGWHEEIASLIDFLHTNYSANNYDLRDKYTLAIICLGCDLEYEGVHWLRQIVADHQANYRPRDIKVALRAYSKLLGIYQKEGNKEAISNIVETLSQNYPTTNFDSKDKYALATIYSEHGLEVQEVKLLHQIIARYQKDRDPRNIKTVLRAYSRLLKIYQAKGKKKQINSLLKSLSPSEDFDSNDKYKLALTYLDYGRKDEGLKLLKEIVDIHPEDTAARKSLFVLANEAQGVGDYTSAISYYQTYIKRYPESKFFVQKAYSRIVDCYWAMGETDLAEDELTQISDIANGISDFRTQLNFARDLIRKGRDTLAEATFNIGLSGAREFIFSNQGTYKALKVYLDIARYGHALGRYNLVEDACQEILKESPELLEFTFDKKSKDNIEFIRSIAHLWLAKTYRDQERDSETVDILKQFLEHYPDHKDVNYAQYELGQAYEKLNMGQEAINAYKLVQYGIWKDKAEERLPLLNPE